MKCKFCGKRIKKGEITCRKCGKQITEDLKTDDLIDAMPQLHDEFDNITKMQAKEKRKKEKKENRAKHRTRRIVVALILVITILAGVAGGMFYYKNRDAENEEEQIVATSAVDSVVERLFLTGDFTDVIVKDVDSARNVIEDSKDVFSISDVGSEYELKSQIKVGNTTFYRFKQIYCGIDVYGGEMVIMADHMGNVVGLNGVYVPTRNLTTAYKIDEGSASTSITEYVNSLPDYSVVGGINITDVEKAICNTENKAYLAYKANVSGYNGSGKYVAYDMFVDGASGNGICVSITSSFENESAITENEIENSYIYEMATASDKFNWNDESMELAEEPLYIKDITLGNASAYVLSVKNAVDNAYNYFDRAFNWKGLAGNGESFKVYINSNEYVEEDLPTEKAMYTNNKLMFFREDLTQGDIDYNTVVHEYAHGVMYNIAGFRGTMELTANSAIAEGLADVFAELAESSITGTAPDWLHGERNFLTPYYMSVPANVEIGTVSDCYKYSTVVSHMAYVIGQHMGSLNEQNEFWFKSMCLMTKNTDFSELGSILTVVADNMHSEGKINQDQYSAISSAIKNLDMGL